MPGLPMTSLARGWMVSVESVCEPSCPSQTMTSSAPPSRKPSTAALISPVSNCRISELVGSVWSWRQTPPTPSASVIMKMVFLACAASGRPERRRIRSSLDGIDTPSLYVLRRRRVLR